MARTLILATIASLCLLAACGGDEAETEAAAPPPEPAAEQSASRDDNEQENEASAAARGGRLRLVGVGRFDDPVYVTAPRGDNRRIFVVEQPGTIRVVRGGRKLDAPFLDIRDQVTAGGEQGLLSMAFAPDYAQSGRFYVYFTANNGDNRVVEYRRASADRADGGSGRQLISQPDDEGNHNGGQLQFGPDGLLYIGLGDGGGGDDQHGARGNAQNLGTWLGKLLRIDPRQSGGRPYRVPSSNPFVGRSGARPEIYSYGLRNPWRFSFDRRTGDLSIGDVGQDAVEEVNFVRRGRGRGDNYGWRPFEGNRRNFNEPAPGHVRPVLTYSRAGGNCSVTGGYVVRDRTVPALAGRYVYGDFCAGRLLVATLRANGARNRRSLGLRVPGLSSFGEDARGRVYATSLSNGVVYRLVQR